MKLKRLSSIWNRLTRNDMNENFDKIERDFNGVVDVVSNKAYDQVVDAAKLIWLTPVATFDDLATTYPNAREGDTAMAREVVGGVNKAYRYNGTEWKEIQQYSADAINEVDHRLTTQLAHMIEDNAVSPDSFEGTDLQKVQQAVDFCIQYKTSIKLARLYDLSGGTILINKNDAERIPLTFFGVGGGFRKLDSTFMFSSGIDYTGDIHFNSVVFRSEASNSTIVFDADKIIRVHCIDCMFRNVDTIVKATLNYIQSYRFIGGSIIGGNGDAILCPAAFDLVFTSTIVEHRENFFTQTVKQTDGIYDTLYQVCFKDMCVEGLLGRAFYIKKAEAFNIDGLYLEANGGGHIVLASDAILTNASFSNIRVQQIPTARSYACIVWGGTLKNVKTSNIRGGISIPNHDTTNVISGQIMCENDNTPNNPNVDPAKRLIYISLDNQFELKTPSFTHVSTFGQLKRLYKEQGFTITKSSKQQCDITISEIIKKDDLITVSIMTPNSPTSTEIDLYSWYVANNTIRCQISNSDTVNDRDVTVSVVVLKFPYSTY